MLCNYRLQGSIKDLKHGGEAIIAITQLQGVGVQEEGVPPPTQSTKIQILILILKWA